MEGFPKPVIVASRCLGFAACRYNGVSIENDFVKKLRKHVDYITVCPEVEIGLGVPREPIRIAKEGGSLRLFQPASGKDVTQDMVSFSSRFLDSLDAVDGFILKYKSPSCGMKGVKIYHSRDPASGSGKGSGFFGSAVMERYPYLPVEDEARLRNISIREDFLNKAFTYARFRQVEDLNGLMEFHTKNKYILMAYNQTRMRELGRIVAGQKGFKKTREEYENALRKALSGFPKAGVFINVIEHAFGGISKMLTAKERGFFISLLEEYRDERIPLAVLTTLIRAWALRYGNEYLLEQTFFEPFPKELMETEDKRFRKDYARESEKA